MSHVHAWKPDEAPTYRCEGCGRIGIRNLRTNRIGLVDPLNAEWYEECQRSKVRDAIRREEGAVQDEEPLAVHRAAGRLT